MLFYLIILIFYIATFYNHKLLNEMSFFHFGLGSNDDIFLSFFPSFHYASPYFTIFGFGFHCLRFPVSSFILLLDYFVGFRLQTISASWLVGSKKIKSRRDSNPGRLGVVRALYPLDHDAPYVSKTFQPFLFASLTTLIYFWLRFILWQ